MKIDIHTRISKDHYERAKLNNIAFGESTELGIDIKNNIISRKKKELIDHRKKLRAELLLCDQKLEKIEKQEEERKKLQSSLTEQEIKYLKSVKEKLNKGAEIQAVLRFFNNTHEKNLNLKDFEYLIKQNG